MEIEDRKQLILWLECLVLAGLVLAAVVIPISLAVGIQLARLILGGG